MRSQINYEHVHQIAAQAFKALDVGHIESIYQKAIVLDLMLCGHKCECEKTMPIVYKEQQIGFVRADMFINDRIVVELKAVATVQPAHLQQVRRYGKLLQTSEMMLINFPLSGILEVHAFSAETGKFVKMQALECRAATDARS